MKTIKNEYYTLNLDEKNGILLLSGRLRLASLDDYQPIIDNLKRLSILVNETITLNISQLAFLNSLGIVVLSRFVIDCRKRKDKDLVITYTDDIPWQKKSVNNLQRLLPSLKLQETHHG